MMDWTPPMRVRLRKLCGFCVVCCIEKKTQLVNLVSVSLNSDWLVLNNPFSRMQTLVGSDFYVIIVRVS